MDGIPIIKEYKYLGVIINHRGNLDEHLKEIKKRALRLACKAKYVVRDLHFKKNQHFILSSVLSYY